MLDSFEQDSEVEKLKDKMRSIASRKVQVFKCEQVVSYACMIVLWFCDSRVWVQCMVMSKKKPELCFQKRHNVARVSSRNTKQLFRTHVHDVMLGIGHRALLPLRQLPESSRVDWREGADEEVQVWKGKLDPCIHAQGRIVLMTSHDD